jgi:hypothetical protein
MKYEIKYLINEKAPITGEAETYAKFVEQNKTDLSYADLSYADLSYANLRRANLRNADLRNADLENADLCYADLSYADIDYTGWQLSCKTYNVTVDKNIAAQIAMHFCWLNCNDEEVKQAQEELKPLAMKCMHWKELPWDY